MARKQHLVRSHAHEEDIPGTVNVQAVEGDDAFYGQALFPVPAEDPNDPLQWSRAKKITILVIMCGYSFLGNSALLGPGPYLTLWSEIFDISPGDASTLISYPNLAYGFSSLLLVPLYLKFGRRPFIAGLIGSACANSFAALMTWRVISSFGAGICEALPVQLVNDIFFLHERGKHIGYYTFGMCFAAVATIPAAYMLPTRYSWRLFFYVSLAFAIALFILASLFVEETSYDREAHRHQSPSPENLDGVVSNGSGKPEGLTIEQASSTPERKSFLMTLHLWGYVNPEVDILTLMWRSFTYFLVPQVLWVVTSFGTIIGLGALAFNFVFPIKITAPPYNWSEANSGVQSLGSLLGFLLALPFTSSSDRLAAYLTRRNHGIREAEMRLGVMLPAMIIGPVGNTSEMLIAINVGKQAVSFGLGFGVLDWVLERGYDNDLN
ncbi:hypothetical protein ABKA04_007110 [Annulohypoxylon sp. FPYF3050]